MHLQAADVVLPQNGEQPVVGVLAHAPLHVIAGRRPRGVIEKAKQHQRVGGIAVMKVAGRQAQAERDAFQQLWPRRVTAAM
jgi:hypothetical protein